MARITQKLSPEGLARSSSRHPWVTLGLWVVAVVVGFLLTGALLGKALTTDGDFINNPDSKRAQQLVQDRLTGPDRAGEVITVRSDTNTVDDRVFEGYVRGIQQRVTALGSSTVESAASYYDTQDPVVLRWLGGQRSTSRGQRSFRRDGFLLRRSGRHPGRLRILREIGRSPKTPDPSADS